MKWLGGKNCRCHDFVLLFSIKAESKTIHRIDQVLVDSANNLGGVTGLGA